MQVIQVNQIPHVWGGNATTTVNAGSNTTTTNTTSCTGSTTTVSLFWGAVQITKCDADPKSGATKTNDTPKPPSSGASTPSGGASAPAGGASAPAVGASLQPLMVDYERETFIGNN